jgi:cytochrome b561
MSIINSDTNFGSIAKFFHWIIALLVIFMIPLGFCMSLASGSIFGFLISIHKSCGLTLLFLVILAYLWRLINKRPKFTADTPVWQAKTANRVQSAMYLFLFLQTLSGWIMSTAAGHVPNFWWIVKIPAPWVSVNKTTSKVCGFIHHYSAWILVGLICLHILAALYHWWIRRDGVFQRMQPNFTKKKRFYDDPE